MTGCGVFLPVVVWVRRTTWTSGISLRPERIVRLYVHFIAPLLLSPPILYPTVHEYFCRCTSALSRPLPSHPDSWSRFTLVSVFLIFLITGKFYLLDYKIHDFPSFHSLDVQTFGLHFPDLPFHRSCAEARYSEFICWCSQGQREPCATIVPMALRRGK